MDLIERHTRFDLVMSWLSVKFMKIKVFVSAACATVLKLNYQGPVFLTHFHKSEMCSMAEDHLFALAKFNNNLYRESSMMEHNRTEMIYSQTFLSGFEAVTCTYLVNRVAK